MSASVTHRVAEYLDNALGDLLDDVAFVDLVEDVVANLEAVADHIAGVCVA